MTAQSKTELIDQAIKDLDGNLIKVANYWIDGHNYLAFKMDGILLVIIIAQLLQMVYVSAQLKNLNNVKRSLNK